MIVFKNKFILTATFLLSFFSVQLFAQTASSTIQKTESVWSNSLFLLLLLINFILLVFIIAIAKVYKKAAELYLQKIKEDKANIVKTIIFVIGFTLFSGQLLAQETKEKAAETIAPITDSSISGLNPTAFYLLLGAALLQLAIFFFLLKGIKNFIQTLKKETEEKTAAKKLSLLEQLNDSVSIENETSIMLDHDYDGIRELDNDLPPWWKYGFYLTIIVAIVYLAVFHVFKTGDLQLAEYDKEMTKATKELEERRKNSANTVDENNIPYLTAATELDSGKELFVANCSPCHGKSCEGIVGPNLTDDYWLHGGSMNSIFKSIKYGIPDKGMKAWQEDFSPTQIVQISSYIKSLKGSNPPNAKEKQGDLYTEETSSTTKNTETKAN